MKKLTKSFLALFIFYAFIPVSLAIGIGGGGIGGVGDTLTNKTLITPTISGPTISGQISQGTYLQFKNNSSLGARLHVINNDTGSLAGDGLVLGILDDESAQIMNNEFTDTVFGSNGVSILTIAAGGDTEIGGSQSTSYIRMFNNDTGTVGGLNGLTFGLDANEQVLVDNHSLTNMLFSTGGTVRLRVEAGGDVAVTSGRLTVVDDVVSTKACATGYTRFTPNYCVIDDVSGTVLTKDVCTTIAKPATDAKGIKLQLEAQVRATGSATRGIRSATVDGYQNSSCSTTGNGGRASSQYIEPASTFNSTEPLSFDYNTVDLYYNDTTVSVKFTADTGTQGVGIYSIIGYYD